MLHLRFLEDLTQAEIAQRIGVSQMHVSRILRRALDTRGPWRRRGKGHRLSGLTAETAATSFSPEWAKRRGKIMADAGLFIGWGAPVYGREEKGLEVFNESLAYYGRLQQDGVIEGFETAILEPHGGDLAGFILIRGSQEQLAQLRVDEEFVRMSTRAGLIVERIGVVGATLGEGLEGAITTYQQAISELA